jgi:hypothetical protein
MDEFGRICCDIPDLIILGCINAISWFYPNKGLNSASFVSLSTSAALTRLIASYLNSVVYFFFGIFILFLSNGVGIYITLGRRNVGGSS